MIKTEDNEKALLMIASRKIIDMNILSPLSWNAQRCLSLIAADRYLSKCDEANNADS